ncbi:MAG: adenylate/guanylate cyclase domain-containing protein [Acidimicrobiia bacterium]|nr:adenylate/guanylate cyclase domain-containing protein [Acidimicrobiia bacterium]
MDIPETRYARAGELRIAFQEWGEGSRSIIIPPLVSNIDILWEHEFYSRMLEHLGLFLRVIHFDKRGIGLSDRFDEIPTLDERIQDIEAVLDTAGWQAANVIGVSEGAVMAQRFALEHRERVDKLVLLSSAAPAELADRARELSGDAYRELEDRRNDFIAVAESWGEDARPFVELMSPSQIGNEPYTRWVNRLNRLSASPADFGRQVQSTVGLNAGLRPDQLAVPTLVVHLTDDRVIPVGHGRVLAEIIPQVEYLEVDGTDHFLATLPNWREVVDPMIEFLTGTTPPVATQRRFATVLFTDIVSSTALAGSLGDARWRDLVERHDKAVHRVAGQRGGRIVKSTGDGVLATFDTPSIAIEAAQNIQTQVGEMGLTLRVGLHAGEIEVHADGDISGVAVTLAARIEQAASDGSIFVSSTVKEMLLGSPTEFEDQGEHVLKGIDGRWRLYAVRS